MTATPFTNQYPAILHSQGQVTRHNRARGRADGFVLLQYVVRLYRSARLGLGAITIPYDAAC